MNHWGHAERVPTSPWKGVLTVPRSWSLRREDASGAPRLRQLPIEELRALRGRGRTWTTLPLVSGSNPLVGLEAETGELVAEFEVGAARKSDCAFAEAGGKRPS